MWSTTREIASGDIVIIWMTRDLIQPLTITPGAVLHNKFGVYPHDSIIGKPYGSKFLSQNGKGFLYVLRPTPELWTLALPHRTQILYLADIAFIIEWLGIKKGSRVIEAGTGSASFSHSVARTIGATGQLYSFEFHEQRAAKAKDEFERHGMSSFVTLQHRNVCKDGFAELKDEVDAVFLDLPAPWEAIPHAKKAIRKDHITRICCFSPCIEQVLRTVAALNDAGFTEITTYETLMRPIEVSTAAEFPSLDDVTEKLKQAEVKREDKRQKQIQQNREKEARDKAGKRKLEDVEGVEGAGTPVNQMTPTNTEGIEAKRLKTGGDITMEPLSSMISLPVVGTGAVSKALPEVRGHTSYLTFACLVPYDYYSTPVNVLSADGPQGTAAAATLTQSDPLVTSDIRVPPSDTSPSS
ncbi:tRNA methyltransferase complex GCD14 subunit-domain-containing protein [Coprinopsis sp. MPI-PUGE-AT-0042]|nr:tRNA methyltransferase complex GCD14 subunit-domain-containing protein [Coprinopsis sp. MPI-PUGE-AT-0042]